MSSGNSGERYRRKLESHGLVVRKGKGHFVVMCPEGRRILGTFGRTGGDRAGSRGHKNLRASIRRTTGIDIGE